MNARAKSALTTALSALLSFIVFALFVVGIGQFVWLMAFLAPHMVGIIVVGAILGAVLQLRRRMISIIAGVALGLVWGIAILAVVVSKI